MGALHQGHLSLIEIAQAQVDIVVCSIFVNPTQFNDPKDLEKYPRPIETDIKKLEETRCDVLFIPSVEEMYSAGESWDLDLGYLEKVLEGKFRPGHYKGVTQIVKKLFDVVKPDVSFFGQKDFQQVKVIEAMVQTFQLPVTVVTCPILREPDGLAMSSRNVHLSVVERAQALALSKTLHQTVAAFPESSIADLKQQAENFLNNSDGVKLEYFEICNAETLRPAESKEEKSLIALLAATVGNTRLIDNIILK